MTKILKKSGILSILFSLLFTFSVKAETWKIQAHLPTGHTVYQFIDDWVKEVNTMLGGRLTLELYPAKAIIPPKPLGERNKPSSVKLDNKLLTPAL